MSETKNWTGNSNSIYKILGASNHTAEERESNDFYATDPVAGEWLIGLERFDKDIWECACGEGHLSRVFENAGHRVKSTDLVYRGFGEGGVDFLSEENKFWVGDIITNPPYKYATDFVEKAMSIVQRGGKVAMFLKLQFLEGKRRKKLFEKYPPKTVYVSSSRILCAKNAEFEKMKKGGGSAVAYGWFVWVKGYHWETTLKWFN